MATTRLPPDFKEFLKLFNAHGVEYLLVGGYAVIHHGYVRTTGDMDVWIAVNPANAARIVAALKEFGFATGVSEDLFLRKGPMTRMGIVPFRIELLTSVSGIDFDSAFSRRIRTTIDDIDVNVISLDDLKTNKKASGRLRDLADVESLESPERLRKRKDKDK